MIDKLKLVNFLQDFGCARIEQLEILFEIKNDNFKNVLNNNIISKKNNILVHNTKKIDDNILIALDVFVK